MDKNTWLSLHKEGYTCAEIAAIFECHPGTVRQYLKAKDVQMLRSGPVAKPTPPERRCVACKVTRPIKDFYPSPGRPGGYDYRCRICKSDNQSKYRKYGLSYDDFEALVAKQEGKCAICNVHKGNTLVVDHCHKSGKVRGLLCSGCNTGLGLLGDTRENLHKALRYLVASVEEQ